MGVFRIKIADTHHIPNPVGISIVVGVVVAVVGLVVALLFAPPTFTASILPAMLLALRLVLLFGGLGLLIAGIIDKNKLMMIIGAILIPVGIIVFILLLPLNP